MNVFPGFTDRTNEFFMAIRFNNNREFFLANRDWYLESVRNPCLKLAESLAESVEELDPTLERRPNKVVSRINRDLRFTNDKSPYRDYIWLAFRRPGEERRYALGVYFDFSDNGASYGMGFYSENKPVMRAHRQELMRDPAPFAKIAEKTLTRFTLHADTVKRMSIPENLPEDLRKWYPLNGFYVEKEINDDKLLKSPALADDISDGYRFLKPLYDYFTQLTPIYTTN